MSNKPGFRYDLNTLRAVAVLAVLFFHFKMPFFGGGFVGVDIFFVISGYLMTGIIMKGLFNGNFSVIDFYNRRAKRIIPELLLMVFSVVFITFFFYLPVDYSVVAKNATASLLFFSNILYAKANYFDASSDNNVFLHTWSLSVEWQFYLLLPLLIMLLNRFFKGDKNKFLILFVIATVAVFLFTVLFTKRYPSYSFYLLPTRTWEMLIGGIAFLLEGRVKIRRSKELAITGYLLIFASIFFFNDRLSWPGLTTLLPVGATFMVVLANVNVFSILHHQVVQLTGKLSYSIYLWHWPIFVIANYLGIQAGLLQTVLFFTLSILFAYFSFTLIEKLTVKKSFSVYLSALLVAIVTSSFTMLDINRTRFSKKALLLSKYKDDHAEEAVLQFNKRSCFISSENEGTVDFDKVSCLTLEKNMENILLVGDSHAAHLSQSLREDLEAKNVHLLQASVSGCLPLLQPEGESRCEEIIHYVYDDFIQKNAEEIDGILISANWCSQPTDDVVQDLRKTLKHLEKWNIPALIIGQNETYTIPYTSIAAREFEYGLSISDQYITEKSAVMNDTLRVAFKDDYVDIFALASVPKLSKNDEPYMMDQNHYTKYGADFVSERILEDKVFRGFMAEALHKTTNSKNL